MLIYNHVSDSVSFNKLCSEPYSDICGCNFRSRDIICIIQSFLHPLALISCASSAKSVRLRLISSKNVIP